MINIFMQSIDEFKLQKLYEAINNKPPINELILSNDIIIKLDDILIYTFKVVNKNKEIDLAFKIIKPLYSLMENQKNIKLNVIPNIFYNTVNDKLLNNKLKNAIDYTANLIKAEPIQKELENLNITAFKKLGNTIDNKQIFQYIHPFRESVNIDTELLILIEALLH